LKAACPKRAAKKTTEEKVPAVEKALAKKAAVEKALAKKAAVEKTLAKKAAVEKALAKKPANKETADLAFLKNGAKKAVVYYY
jgi:hypothetical protein